MKLKVKESYVVHGEEVHVSVVEYTLVMFDGITKQMR